MKNLRDRTHGESGGTGHRLPALGLFLLGLMVVAAGPACRREVASKPVSVAETPDLVLIVTVDSLRWDMLGAYGDPTGVSPAFDRLAEKSHLFLHAYATSSWTKPSIASLLTSSIVSDHLVYLSTLEREPVIKYLKTRIDADYDRLYLRGNVLPPNIPLFHEFLPDFRKAAFVDNVHLRSELGFARGWDNYTHYTSRKNEEGVPGNADRINHDVLEFLDDHHGEKAAVWIHYFDVHWPYGPIEPYGATFLQEGVGLLPTPYSYEAAEKMVQGNHDTDSLIATTVLPGIYRAGLRIFDDALGELFEQLAARRLFNRALIVVTSDHGDEFFEHGRFGHGHNLYDTTVRIPMLIKLPGQASIQRHLSPVSLTDIGPTILETCGVFPAEALPGESLYPMMLGRSLNDRTPVFELVNLELENLKGIVDTEYKLIVEVDGDEVEGRIFGLGDDFRPLDSSVAGDHGVALRDRLHSMVRKWDPRLLLLEVVSKSDEAPREIEHVDEIIEQLKAIGYIQPSER